MFVDRTDAGRQLAARLREYAGSANAVVLGIPRGGVVVAAEVARELQLPLDIVLAAKVGAPGNPEYAIGAVAPDGVVLVNEQTGLDAATVEAASEPARDKLAHEMSTLRGDLRPRVITAANTAIVVDDGLATGLTALAAVRHLKRLGATVVLAVPVASEGSVRLLEPEADALVVLDVPLTFGAVGQFYSQFGQTTDDEVRTLLGEAANT
jgi:putative phosphoribosyl transferase